jgi:hypothetical protein
MTLNETPFASARPLEDAEGKRIDGALQDARPPPATSHRGSVALVLEAAESIPSRVRFVAVPRAHLGGDTDALDWLSDPHLMAILARASTATERLARRTNPP